MKIELKLGSVTVSELVECMNAKLYTHSQDAPFYEIELMVDDISEIKAKTLFVVSEDNSLAEMMAAAKNGSKCVICTQAPDSLEKITDIAVIECENINSALELFARAYAKRGKYKSLAVVTGKSKSLTGDFVYSVLEEKYKVFKSTDKSFSEKESALALLKIPATTDVFLSETKMRDKKDALRLSEILNCEIENDMEILSCIKGGREVAICACDDGTHVLCVTCDENSVCCEDMNIKAENIQSSEDKTTFDIVGENVLIKNAEIHFEGEESIRSALCAAFIGIKHGIPHDKIRTGLKNCHSFELGVEIFTEGGVTFIVDSSSATVDSVKKDIDVLCNIANLHKGARKIALIGDIRDFGQDTRLLHEKMGEYIVEKKFNKLFTFGVAAEQICVGARRAGMPDEDIKGNLELFSPLKSAEAVAAEISSGDVVLIRIGRRNAAEEIVQYLRSRFKK